MEIFTGIHPLHFNAFPEAVLIDLSVGLSCDGLTPRVFSTCDPATHIVAPVSGSTMNLPILLLLPELQSNVMWASMWSPHILLSVDMEARRAFALSVGLSPLHTLPKCPRFPQLLQFRPQAGHLVALSKLECWLEPQPVHFLGCCFLCDFTGLFILR